MVELWRKDGMWCYSPLTSKIVTALFFSFDFFSLINVEDLNNVMVDDGSTLEASGVCCYFHQLKGMLTGRSSSLCYLVLSFELLHLLRVKLINKKDSACCFFSFYFVRCSLKMQFILMCSWTRGTYTSEEKKGDNIFFLFYVFVCLAVSVRFRGSSCLSVHELQKPARLKEWLRLRSFSCCVGNLDFKRIMFSDDHSAVRARKYVCAYPIHARRVYFCCLLRNFRLENAVRDAWWQLFKCKKWKKRLVLTRWCQGYIEVYLLKLV